MRVVSKAQAMMESAVRTFLQAALPLRRCPKCGETKALSEFWTGNSYCNRCDVDRVKKWRRANPTKVKNHVLTSRYGINLGRYKVMLIEQQGGCAACGYQPKDGNCLHIDHNHACCPGDKSCGDCIRGLLCGQCNVALGMLNDDPERIKALAAYLDQHNDR